MEDKIAQAIGEYDFVVRGKHRTRGAFLLETNQGLRILREQEKENPHFELENQVKTRLREAGFDRIDYVIPNRAGEFVTILETGERYIVYQWFYGEECDLRNENSLQMAAANLSRMHKILNQMESPGGDVTEDLYGKMMRRTRELRHIYTYMKNRKGKNEMEIAAIACFPEYYEQASQAVGLLAQSPYSKDPGRMRGMCHGDYNYHNILFGRDGLATTNFGKCCYDATMLDLYYFLRKTMEKNNWSMGKGEAVLAGYEENIVLTDSMRELLYLLMLFPEKYWKLMNQYYNRKKAWMSRRNLDKLIGIKEQARGRQQFLSRLRG